MQVLPFPAGRREIVANLESRKLMNDTHQLIESISKFIHVKAQI